MDALLDMGTRMTAIEVKAGRTIPSDCFKGLKFFLGLQGVHADSVLVYGGDESSLREGVRVRTWPSVVNRQWPQRRAASLGEKR